MDDTFNGDSCSMKLLLACCGVGGGDCCSTLETKVGLGFWSLRPALLLLPVESFLSPTLTLRDEDPASVICWETKFS
jgi:hypothetical protein